MSSLSVRCIRAALVYLGLGVCLGAGFALYRPLGASLRPLHVELNLWGWVTLLIYGMAYHMLPRFTGRPLRWPRLAAVQSFLAIGGVALAAMGWLASIVQLPYTRELLLAGGAMQVVAALSFTLLIGDMLIPRGLRS